MQCHDLSLQSGDLRGGVLDLPPRRLKSVLLALEKDLRSRTVMSPTVRTWPAGGVTLSVVAAMTPLSGGTEHVVTSP